MLMPPWGIEAKVTHADIHHMRRDGLNRYWILAFGIAWGIPGLALLLARLTGAFQVSIAEYTPLSFVALWAPAIAAFAIIGQQHGWQGMCSYAQRLGQFKGHWGWYVAVLLGIPALNGLAAVMGELAGQHAIAAPTLTLSAWLRAALLRATEGPMEELGWRGFALPLLQQQYSGFRAALILGFMWALWHVPALLLGRSVGGGGAGSWPAVLVLFFSGLMVQSVIMTVIYNATEGSMPLAFLFHWMTNLPYPWETGVDLSRITFGLWLGIAIALGVVGGDRYLGTRNQCVQVLGDAEDNQAC